MIFNFFCINNIKAGNNSFGRKGMRRLESNWKNQNIFDLFKLVETYRKENKPIVKAFEKYAIISGRKKFSIRNFYYNKLSEFEKNQTLAEKFQIDFSKHNKNEQKFFTPQEAELSITQINDLMKKGYSVRKACYEIASGDVKQMLRLQNKFRSLNRKTNILGTENKLKNSITNKISFNNGNSNQNSKQKEMGNVLFMPTNKALLTDSEITSLFMGLVKLVKKAAKEQYDLELLNQVQSANAELRKSIKSLADKEREIKFFRKKFELLSNEKVKLKEELSNLRSQNVELLKAETSPIKINKLKSYINKLGRKTRVPKETT